MKILRAVILVFVFLLPSANAFGAVSSFNDSKSVGSEDAQTANGIAFNPDGTKCMSLVLAKFSNMHYQLLLVYHQQTIQLEKIVINIGDTLTINKI